MTSWIGQLGSLQKVVCASKAPTSSSRPVSSFVAMSGRTRSRVSPQAVPRQWQVGINVTDPKSLLSLHRALHGQLGHPLVWVDENMQVTNVLTPRQSMLSDVWTLSVPGGPVALADGAVSGESMVPQFVDQVQFLTDGSETAIARVPVVPGVPVTAGLWAAVTGKQLQVLWRRADASGIGGVSVALPSGVGWRRMSVTATPPADTAFAYLGAFGSGAVTDPTLTWTSQLMPPAVGAGVSAVQVTGATEDPIMAHTGLRGTMRTATYTVQETGG